jgi:hypothetical protein
MAWHVLRAGVRRNAVSEWHASGAKRNSGKMSRVAHD